MSAGAMSADVSQDAPAWRAIAPGLLCVDSPLPFRGLKQINLWFIEDHRGWTMVDCGFSSPQVRDQLEGVWRSALGGKPVTRLIVTHFHPDHMANCGWIAKRWGLEPHMTTSEWMAAQLAARDLFTDDIASSSRFFARHGLPADQIASYANDFILYSSCVELPSSYHPVDDGDVISIGGREWRVIIGAGHSPAMLTLYCADLGIYIAGDQILPRITPNISNVHWAPEDDNLHRYETSLRKISELVPDDVLVLPSHKLPFRGLHHRITELLEHHESRLDILRRLVFSRREVTTAECMKALFGFELDGQQIFFAAGETIAHMNRLCRLGEAELVETGAGCYFYRGLQSFN